MSLSACLLLPPRTPRLDCDCPTPASECRAHTHTSHPHPQDPSVCITVTMHRVSRRAQTPQASKPLSNSRAALEFTPLLNSNSNSNTSVAKHRPDTPEERALNQRDPGNGEGELPLATRARLVGPDLDQTRARPALSGQPHQRAAEPDQARPPAPGWTRGLDPRSIPLIPSAPAPRLAAPSPSPRRPLAARPPPRGPSP